jgi:hypothetical protein
MPARCAGQGGRTHSSAVQQGSVHGIAAEISTTVHSNSMAGQQSTGQRESLLTCSWHLISLGVCCLHQPISQQANTQVN